MVFTLSSAAAQEAPAEATCETPEECSLGMALEARTLFREGNITECIGLLLRARRAFDHPQIAYNLARAYDNAGELKLARDEFERFLRVSPDAPNRGDVTARIESIGETLAERSAQDAARLAAEEDAEASRRAARSRTNIAWVLTGLGAAGLATAGVTGILSRNEGERALELAEMGQSHDAVFGPLERSENLALGANISLAAGGVLLSAGIAWLIGAAMNRGRTQPTR